jgi:hypothetical protein
MKPIIKHKKVGKINNGNQRWIGRRISAAFTFLLSLFLKALPHFLNDTPPVQGKSALSKKQRLCLTQDGCTQYNTLSSLAGIFLSSSRF